MAVRFPPVCRLCNASGYIHHRNDGVVDYCCCPRGARMRVHDDAVKNGFVEVRDRVVVHVYKTECCNGEGCRDCTDGYRVVEDCDCGRCWDKARELYALQTSAKGEVLA